MTHITGSASPQNIDELQAYAERITAQVGTLNEKPLKEVNDLRNQVIKEIGTDRLDKAERQCKKNSVRYYLWAKEHPRLDTFFRIITFGYIHSLAVKGQARYEKNKPILEIAKSVGIIDSIQSEKSKEVHTLSNELSKELYSYHTFFPSKVLKLLDEQVKINGEVVSSSSQRVGSFLEACKAGFLNASKTYLDNTYYTDLITLYRRVAPNSQALADLQETKAVYTHAQEWPSLSFDTKLTLLETMQEQPKRYRSILQQIISETEKLLTWEQFSTKSAQERQEIITQINIILDIPNLDGANVLSDALTTLRTHIRTSYFKECDWNNQQVVQHLEGVCQNLDIVDECAIAKETAFLEANWDEHPFLIRIDNTALLVQDDKHYGTELERRRKEVFGMLEGLVDLPIDKFEYVIDMLHELKPAFTKGCTQALKSAKEQLLARMEKVAKSDEPRDDLIAKAQIIGIDEKILNEFTPQGWISSAFMYLYTGKSKSERLEETVTADLLKRRQKLRALGVPTPISHVPTPQDVAKLQIADSHLKVGPPSIGQLNYKSKITELNDFLKEADREGLIPASLTESTSDTSSLQFHKNDLLYKLSLLFNTLQYQSLNDRLTRVRDVLGAYTDHVKERLKAAKNQSEKREIYTELVELVCKEIGFACYHCEDRKVNAAMMIYNEKLATEVADSGKPQQKVLEWLAQKRDALVSNMLQEMVQHNISTSILPIFYDVSSSISRWRYVLRRQLGLGDVPSPAYSIDSGLSESQIVNRFKQTYTPEWILEQAMEEHAKENGNKALKITAINEFLESRISNFDDVKFDLLDEESYKLLKGGMALYLQEIGVFNPIL